MAPYGSNEVSSLEDLTVKLTNFGLKMMNLY